MKFGCVVAIFPNLVANNCESHVVVNGLVTFWLISTSVEEEREILFIQIGKEIEWFDFRRKDKGLL